MKCHDVPGDFSEGSGGTVLELCRWYVYTCNVGSRLVWGFSIVRSFAEVVQHPLGSFGGP